MPDVYLVGMDGYLVELQFKSTGLGLDAETGFAYTGVHNLFMHALCVDCMRTRNISCIALLECLRGI
jgi:hypothetical protein